LINELHRETVVDSSPLAMRMILFSGGALLSFLGRYSATVEPSEEVAP
jgi:hypothetical protein